MLADINRTLLFLIYSFIFMSDSESYFEFGSSDEEWQDSSEEVSDELESSASGDSEEGSAMEDVSLSEKSEGSSTPLLKRNTWTRQMEFPAPTQEHLSTSWIPSRKETQSPPEREPQFDSSRLRLIFWRLPLPTSPMTTPISESSSDAGETSTSHPPQSPGS